MTIIWSDEAKLEYHENIEYLTRVWSEKSAGKFVADVENVIELIKMHPELYPLCGHLSVRRAVIRKQITMFYRVKHDEIQILRFWNNYKDDSDRDF